MITEEAIETITKATILPLVAAWAYDLKTYARAEGKTYLRIREYGDTWTPLGILADIIDVNGWDETRNPMLWHGSETTITQHPLGKATLDWVTEQLGIPGKDIPEQLQTSHYLLGVILEGVLDRNQWFEGGEF